MPAIPTLSPNLSPGTTVLFDGSTYRPGDTYEYDGDPCKVLAFVEAAIHQVQEQEPDKNWAARAEVVEGWATLCDLQQALDGVMNTLNLNHDPAAEQPELTGGDSPPPSNEERADTLGAPAPPIAVEEGPEIPVERTPSLPLRPTPAEQYYDGKAPRTGDDLADLLLTAGLPGGALPDAVERARRGDPPPGAPHPFRARPEVERQAVTAADPVNLFSGEYIITTVDLEIPSRGFPFRLERIYASGRPYFGPWGFNWDHNYNVYLRELEGGGVAIWTGRLQEDVYELTPAGDYEPPPGVFALLQPERDAAGIVVGYSIAFRGGFSWQFRRLPGWPDPERIPLVRLADTNGNAQHCRYDAEGRLERVLDTAGRPIRFHYGQCGLLEAVTDFAGRTLEYHHAPHAEHLVRVSSPATDYAPEGLVTCYEYDDLQEHPALQHNVVRVIDPAGRTVVENEYGREPGSDDFNRVVRQYYLGEEYRYACTRLRYVPPLPEAINDAYLRVEYQATGRPLQVYTFNFRGSLLDERFRLCADGSYRLWAMTYRYNGQGALIEMRRPNGLGLRYTYDENNADPRARGNLLAVRLSSPPTSLLPDRQLWQLTYEPRFQKLKTATDEAGATTTYSYDYEVDPLGQGAGNLVRIERPDATLPDGVVQQGREEFQFNAAGQVTEWRTAEGHRFTYAYYAAGPNLGYLERIVAGAGASNEPLDLDYDAYGNVRTATNATGRVTEWSYNALNQLLRLRAPAVNGNPGEIVYEYGRDGRLTALRTPRGSYDDGVITDPFLRQTLEVDQGRRLRTETYGANTVAPRRRGIAYNSDGAPVEIVDALGRVTQQVYDERHLVLRRTEYAGTAEQRTTTYAYDRNGNLVRRTDPTGRVTLYRYDTWDRLQEVEQVQAGTRLRYHYDPRDQIARIEVFGPSAPDRASVLLSEVRQDFDERGRLLRRTAASHLSEFWYDRDDRLVRVLNERGHAIHLIVDALGRTVQATDALNNQVRYTFDNVGDLVQVEEREQVPGAAGPEVYITTLTYDARHRLRSVTDPAGNTWAAAYDDRDLLVSSTSPRGVRHEYGHNLDGRVSLARVWAGQPPRPVTHRWHLDAGGRLERYTDPEGRETHYTFNLADQWIAITWPGGLSHRRFFNAAGQLEQEATPGGTVITYTYNMDGHVGRVVFRPGPGVLPLPDLVYERDGLGRPVRLVQGGVTLDLAYDAVDRLVAETLDGRTCRWRYDDAAGTADLVYPDGRVDRYEMDALGRIGAIRLQQRAVPSLIGAALPAGSTLTRYEYAGRERLHQRVLGNGCTTSYRYDRARRLSHLIHSQADGNLMIGLEYVYDGDGRRRIERAQPAPLLNALFGGDDLSHLIQVAEGVPIPAVPANADQAAANAYIQALGQPAALRTYDFQVNAADARQQQVTNDQGVVTTDDYRLNDLYQITQVQRTTPQGITTSTFAYDGDGLRRQDGRFSYGYDALGRLREVRDRQSGDVLLTQTYDPAGRVMQRTVGNAPPLRLRYLGARLLQEEMLAGPPLRQSCLGLHADELVAQSDGTNRWGHQDGRRSLLAVSDDAGRVAGRYAYTSFGQPSVWAADGFTPLAAANVGVAPIFGGHRALGLDALYAARARTYDATTGCFLQRDRRGYAGSANLYVYAGHNPVDFVDPSGEVAPVIAALVLSGAAAGVWYSAHDALEHPERYQGHFSWRTLFQTYGGAAIGGVSAIVGEAVLAWGSLAGGGAAVGSGSTLTIAQSFVIGGTVSAAGGLAWRVGFHGLFPELTEPPNAHTLAQDYALGGVISLGFRAWEAVGNPVSRAGWNTIRVNVAEAIVRARAWASRLVGDAQRAAQIRSEIAELRVGRLHAPELQGVRQPAAAPLRRPGQGQTLEFTDIDVVTDSAWIQVKTSEVPGRAARFGLQQAEVTVAGSPTGRTIYYVEPGRGYRGVVRDLLAAGVTEVRPLSPALRGTEPFPLPFGGRSGFDVAHLPWSFLLDPEAAEPSPLARK